MRVGLAYVFIILLWGTTPLAIKWSSEGAGFLFAGMARMTIGVACLLLVLAIKRQRLQWHRSALLTYAAITMQIYGSMVPVYWAAQFIPSGWISVILGLSPLITAVLAAIWLAERSLSQAKIFSYLLSVSGLAIMYGSALELGPNAVLGMVAVVFSAFLQCSSAVWIKRINAKIPALAQVTGGLLMSLPLYWGSWAIADGHWPKDVPVMAWAGIAYLGAIASTIGFVLYYYLLKKLGATQVALITLISPVLALLLGHVLNQEPLTLKIVGGTLCILAALSIQVLTKVSFKKHR
ncbi:MAG: DMT family transporter [Methylococcales bacterium]